MNNELSKFITFWSMTKAFRSNRNTFDPGTVCDANGHFREGGVNHLQLFSTKVGVELVMLYEVEADGFTPKVFVDGWHEARRRPSHWGDIGYFGSDWTPLTLTELTDFAERIMI